MLGVLAAFSLCGMSAGALSAGEMPRQLIPVGHTVGVKMFSEGVLVVGLTTLDGTGSTASPAREGGVRTGDLILSVDGTEVESAQHLQQLVQQTEGEEMSLTLRRGQRQLSVQCTAAVGADGEYHLGAWIRDSMAGIGTVTFYDPESGLLGALGHGVTDADTGQIMPLESGSIIGSSVKAVRRGSSGSPGELRGEFHEQQVLGQLLSNTERGIFARAEACAVLTAQEALPVAKAAQVRCGTATVLSNIRGDAVEEFEIEIEKCSLASGSRNMVLRITDPELLSLTGGIVQGMSGSPIIQDGKIVGAVTHVFVDDPAKGYGIFIENMLDAAG